MGDSHVERTTAATAADAQAVRAFQAGERERFSELVTRHKDRIYGLALKMTGSVDDALDVSQDTFIKALSKLDGLQSPEYFGTWLYRIGLNSAISLLRKRGRVKEADNPEVLEQGRPDNPGLPTPAASLGDKERRELVQRALAELPEAQRLAVVLCDLEGQSYEAIATLLDISKGTVMSRIHYGRKRLREKLARYLER